MQTWIDLQFADGEYPFALGLQQINELEKKCDAGLGRIFARTLAGRYGLDVDQIQPELAEYRYGDLIEVVRQGLIGAGAMGLRGKVDGLDVPPLSSSRANDLVSAYLINPTTQRMAVKFTWKVAATVLAALIEGYAPPKKKEPVSRRRPTKGSTTPKP